MVKHEKLEITGKVKADSEGAVFYFKIKKFGYMTVEDMIKMIEWGFEFFYQQQTGPAITDFKIKTIIDDNVKTQYLIGSNGTDDNIDIMSITEIPDSKLTDTV